MFGFFRKEKEMLRESLRLQREMLHRIEQIERAVHWIEWEIISLEPKPLTASITNVFTGDSIMADNILVMNVGDKYLDTITPRLTDGTTLSGGVLSNVVVTFSDPSATAVLQPDNTILFTGVAASTGPVSGSTAVTVTDTDGVVSQWTIPFTVQTNGITPPPPPEQLTQSVANVFTGPIV